MKKASATRPKVPVDDLRPEYRLDYSKAQPNRYAALLNRDTVAVILDPDVAAVFKTSESVNAVLRALIGTMPRTPARKKPAPRSSKV